MHAAVLVRDFIENDPELRSDFVCAYSPGGQTPADLFGTVFHNVKMCTGPLDTQCIINWDSRAPSFNGAEEPFWFDMLWFTVMGGYGPKPERGAPHKPRFVVNPTTWSSNGGGVYLGARVKDEGPALPQSADFGATSINVEGNYLVLAGVAFWKWGPPVLQAMGGNLHGADFALFYYNVKANAALRLAKWTQARSAASRT
eukprot:4027803-Prymnesium_polylepis.2